VYRCVVFVVVIASCGDNMRPVDVTSGRLTARIWSDPAQIQLLVDDSIAWQTERGDADPPYGFAAVGTLAVAVDDEFGSFKLVEDTASEHWRAIDSLANITTTDGGATFDLRAGDQRIGTGALTFVTTTQSGPDPTAAGFPRHVRIELNVDSGDRVSLATPCAKDEHVVGLGGQSFDVDHRGQTVPLWVQEDGIGKDPGPDDVYTGVWFLTGRRHSTHSPMPMMVSSRGYAAAVDTTARAIFALGSKRADVAQLEAWDRTLDLQIFVGAGSRDTPIAGDAARDALGHMIAWVGKPARPPATVFAPWVDAIFGSTNVRAVAAQLRAAGISSSVIWTEDWRGGGDTSTGYALHPTSSSSPATCTAKASRSSSTRTRFSTRSATSTAKRPRAATRSMMPPARHI
jgi:hypothetical protein